MCAERGFSVLERMMDDGRLVLRIGGVLGGMEHRKNQYPVSICHVDYKVGQV